MTRADNIFNGAWNWFPGRGGASQVKTLLVLLLGGLFIYAGVIKLIQPNAFLGDIESYRMLPYSVGWLVAFYLPPLEIICGLGLLWPKSREHAAIVLLVLMLVFVMAIAIAWGRGLDITCGCFGSSDEKANYPWLILRDLLIIGGLFVVIGCSSGRNASEARPSLEEAQL
jgi:uncharacterized membrane protein YphA (DoxX/SURF4 family)